MKPQEQNYASHRRMHAPYHFVLSLLSLAVLIGSVIHMIRAAGDGEGVLPALLLVGIALALLLIFLFLRSYPLKAQDRAIRAEENLRHYVLTGKLLDSRLTTPQIVALRFASDEELSALSSRAAAEGLAPEEIKKAIKKWKGDYYRI